MSDNPPAILEDPATDKPQAIVLPTQMQLRRILGIRDLVLFIIGGVIGSGIFLVPSSVLRSVGNSVPLALTTWLAGGLLSLVGALTYGELSATKPHVGGLYVYIRDCFGPFLAFLFGWTMFFVISSGSIAALAVAFSDYLGDLIPISAGVGKLVSALVIIAIAAINVRGTRHSADLQNITTVIKVLAILLMAALLLWFGKNPILSHTGATSTGRVGSAISGFGAAMISVLWAYEGWQYATYAAGETVNPKRTFPLSSLIGSLALIGIYIFANLGYLAALGPDGVAKSNRVAVSALATVINPGVAKLVTITILISIVGAANSTVLGAPRVFLAMARDGFFFKRLSEVHPRFGTPAFAIVGLATWAMLLATSGTFEQLLTYVVFVGWAFYALAAASIFIYRRRCPNEAYGYRVPLYPFTPLIFIIAAVALVVDTIATQPVRAGVGVGIVALGAPAYAFWRRTAKLAGREDSEHG